ncbi:Stealth CR1 domain-containing protein [Ekhidna sp. To15]|uniref:Stealth CR1 domain-containing protein n=1 Tax=Ekhidna sp. To15 TaxID=3395267 RepID=UPI003F51D164
MSNKIEVDLVYTWVNGEDPDYIKICQSYADNPKDINPERYRDTYQLLKYSLRSAKKYLDWYRNIYIVTARPQVPSWLDTNHPRIKLVHHDEIIDKEYLPTFNPNCIESFLHKIPGLAEHFLYINDDFLFGAKTSQDIFFNNGIHTVFNSLAGENFGWRIYDGKNDLIGLGIIEHTPLFIKKEFWNAMTELYPEKQHESRANKFRKSSDLMTYKFYRYYMMKYQKKLSYPIPLWKLLKVNFFHKIMNKLDYQKKALAKIENEKPNFYCLNDDQRDNPNPDVIKLVQEFLSRNYPDKSSFEL